MSRDYDVIVVGAGPAGASAALHAARLGLRVLVLDKKKFPREKTCGDALSSTSLTCLEELGLLSGLLDETYVRVNRIAYVAPDGESVTVPLLKIDPALPVTGMICRRIILDDHLLRAAREVAEVMDWCRVTGLLTENGQAVGVRAELGGRRRYTFTAKAVVGADGARSIVARNMGVRAYPEYRALAVTAYYRLVTGTMGSLEAHFPREILPGFLWIHPTERGLTNVGLSFPRWRFSRTGPKPRELLERCLRSPFLRERFAFAERFGDIRVSLLPLGNTLRQVHGQGFLLVGDAAGLIHPCSCEGVSTALVSGKVAAETLAEACAAGDCGRTALSAYPARLWKRLGPSFRLADRLLALRTPRAMGSLIRSARRRPHNAGWISGVLMGSALPSEELDTFLGYLDFLGR
ncbi:MAG: NAD(P)/FAD-dependent oxidoreductase [Thermodesulfobacteriota bacterium]